MAIPNISTAMSSGAAGGYVTAGGAFGDFNVGGSAGSNKTLIIIGLIAVALLVIWRR